MHATHITQYVKRTEENEKLTQYGELARFVCIRYTYQQVCKIQCVRGTVGCKTKAEAAMNV